MISVTIITLNEEEKVANALKSIQGLADEIILVDSGSTDKTLKIAKDFGAKLYFRKLDNFASQKNFALSKASGDWILSIDADEQVSQKLAEEIKKAVGSDEYVGFLIPRKNFILAKEIKYSRWSPDMHIWLWKKEFGKWAGEVHEEVMVNGKVGTLKNSKIHNSHETVSEFIQANNKYSDLEANILFKNGIKFSFWKMTWQAVSEFLIRFLFKKGFLDGNIGFILAYLMGIYKLTVWIKLWELNIKSNN